MCIGARELGSSWMDHFPSFPLEAKQAGGSVWGEAKSDLVLTDSLGNVRVGGGLCPRVVVGAANADLEDCFGL